MRRSIDSLQAEARIDQSKDKFFLQSLTLFNNMLPAEQSLLIVRSNELSEHPSTFQIQQFRNPDCYPLSLHKNRVEGPLLFLTSSIDQKQWSIYTEAFQLDRLSLLCPPLTPTSAALIPIVFHSEAIGALLLLRTGKSDDFTYADIEKAMPFVHSLADSVAEVYMPESDALAADNARASNEFNSEDFTSTHLPVLITSKHLNIVECNQPCESLIGLSSLQLSGLPLARVIPENAPGQHLNYNRYHCTGFNRSFFYCYLEKKALHLEVAFRQIRFKGDEYWWVTLHDVTELTRIRHQRQSEISRFEAISDVTPVGVLQVDSHWNYMYSNDMWTVYSGMDRASLGQTEWLKVIPPDMIENIVVKLYASVERNEHCVFEFPAYKKKMDEPRWLRMKMNPFGNNSKNGGMVLVLEDTTELHIQHESLLKMATTDNLTGLTNRAYFGDRLHNEIERAKRGHHFTVISIDLDGFKDINDSLGHDIGDALLVHIAHRLEHAVRDTDITARLGGDEFILLLPDCSRMEDIRHISHKVLTALSMPIQVQGNALQITASMGAYICTSEIQSDMDILKYADLALYEAKRLGKNQLCIYSDRLSQQLQTRLTLSSELHVAWEYGQFEVYFQLQWNRLNQSFEGAEALLRWHHPERGLLAPGEFLTTLEADALIEPVTEFVLDQSIQTAMHWRESAYLPEDGRISVNLSARLFRNRSLPANIARLLEKHQAPGNCLTLEVTESAFLEEHPTTDSVFTDLKKLGIGIALDDFGTGYSPLTYLSRIDMDTLKIDKSFIFNIDDFRNRKIVEIVISLANSLHIGLVAEGIDNRYTYAKLSALGCTRFQGFLLHRPDNKQSCEQTLAEQQKQKQSFMLPEASHFDHKEKRSYDSK